MKTFLTIMIRLAVVTIVLISTTANANGIEVPARKGMSNFAADIESKHRQLLVGLPAKQRKILEQGYPNYKVIAACEGSFKSAGYYEQALALIGTGTEKTIYVALLEKDKNDSLVMEFAKEKGVLENREAWQEITVSCYSAMEVKRLNRGIRESAGLHHGRIDDVTQFDTVCTTHPALPQEHSCYVYNHKLGKFVDAGGWTN